MRRFLWKLCYKLRLDQLAAAVRRAVTAVKEFVQDVLSPAQAERAAPAAAASAASTQKNTSVVVVPPTAAKKAPAVSESVPGTEVVETAASEPVDLTLGHLALLAALGVLLYVNSHSPWTLILAQVAWESVPVRAAIRSVTDMAKARLSAVCRKWRWLDSARKWVIKAVQQPVGKAVLKQLAAFISKKAEMLVSWIDQLAEGTDIRARSPE